MIGEYWFENGTRALFGLMEMFYMLIWEVKIKIEHKRLFFFSFFKFYLFIYLCLHWVFVAARGLLSSCGKWGLVFVAVRVLLTAVASLVAEHGL